MTEPSGVAEPDPPKPPRGLLPERLTRGFEALRVRNYRLFWFGQMISLTGTWMQATAQAWLVFELTRSPVALGLVTTFQFLPITLLSLFAGVITDRFPKYRLLLITQSAALVQALIFGTLVATGNAELHYIYLLAAVQGVITAIDNPTRQAFVPELIGRERLVNAVALNSLLFNGARVVGAALAGAVIAQLGIAPTLYLNALSYFGVLYGLSKMDSRSFLPPPELSSASILAKLAEGLRYVRKTPKIFAVLLIVAAVGTFGYNFSVVLPLLAGFVLETGAGGFGILSAFLGLGSLLAALVLAYRQTTSLRRLLLGSGCFGLLLGAVALSQNFAVSALLLVALGAAGITFTTTANTLLQLSVPNAFRGRVMSLYILLFIGSTPIGSLFIGSLSSLIGEVRALLLCAGLCLGGVVGAALYLKRHQSALE